MSSYCKVIILGRLGRDPEVRSTTNGKKVANFSLATDSGYGENRATDWHNCSAWEKSADIVERFVRKGDLLMVEGRLTYRKYTNKQGADVTAAEVQVDRVTLMPKAGSSESPQSADQRARARGSAESAPQAADDDIPF